MKKPTSFKTAFGASLKRLGPFMFTAAIAAGGVLSQGSWSIFFNRTFPRFFAIFTVVWVVAALYATAHRRSTGVHSNDNGEGDYLPDISNINPTTGSSMIGNSGLDASGRTWGQTD